MYPDFSYFASSLEVRTADGFMLLMAVYWNVQKLERLIVVEECVTAALVFSMKRNSSVSAAFFVSVIRWLFSYGFLVLHFCDCSFETKTCHGGRTNARNVICRTLKHCLGAALTNPVVFRTSCFQQRILVYLSDYVAISIFLLPSSRYNFSVGALTPCKFPLSFRGYPAGLTQFMLYILA